MMTAQKFTVALVQMRMSADPEANFSSTLNHICEAARGCANRLSAGAFPHPVLLPARGSEAFRPGRADSGAVDKKLGEIARELGVAIVASLFERRAPGLYHNTAVTLDADGRSPASTARCISLTIRFTTRILFRARGPGIPSGDTAVGRVGTLVCWDQWYPEGARLTALQGAELLFYPTAIGWHPAEKDEFGAAQYDAWQTIQRSHAIANGVFVAGGESRGNGARRCAGQSRRGAGNRVLGRKFSGRSFRARDRQSRAR